MLCVSAAVFVQACVVVLILSFGCLAWVVVLPLCQFLYCGSGCWCLGTPLRYGFLAVVVPGIVVWVLAFSDFLAHLFLPFCGRPCGMFLALVCPAFGASFTLFVGACSFRGASSSRCLLGFSCIVCLALFCTTCIKFCFSFFAMPCMISHISRILAFFWL